MSKVRVVYKPDKSVDIICPAPKSRRANETEEQWLTRVFDKAMRQPQTMTSEGPKSLDDLGCDYEDVDSSELPQTRKDRDAWEGEKGKGVSVNEIKAAKLRADKKARIKVDKKIRNMAIDDLKSTGEIASDYIEEEGN